MNYDTERQAQERTLALICWQKAQLYAEQRAMREALRRQAKRRLTQIGLGTLMTGIALFVVVRYLYLHFFWF